MAPMALTTMRSFIEQRDQEQAIHWVGIPEVGWIVDSINEPMGLHPPTGSIIEAHAVLTNDPTTHALNIPEPETPQPFSSSDEQ